MAKLPVYLVVCFVLMLSVFSNADPTATPAPTSWAGTGGTNESSGGYNSSPSPSPSPTSIPIPTSVITPTPVVSNYSIPEFNLTELEQRITKLEQENALLSQRVGLLESTVASIQQTLTNLQNSLSNFISSQGIFNQHLSFLPYGTRKDMVCGYIKTNHLTNETAFGLTCKITKGKCVCK